MSDDLYDRIARLSSEQRTLLALGLEESGAPTRAKRIPARAGKRLVAYVVFGFGSAPSPDEFRAFLSQKLPDYMVPSGFVFLEDFPLTPNGKVDRRALAGIPEFGRDERSFVGPRNEIEEVVARIWQEVLGIDRIGVHDNFFELGGHSLVATQILYAVKDIFLVDIPVRELFDSATVAALASAIVAREPSPGQTEKIARVIKTVEAMDDGPGEQ